MRFRAGSSLLYPLLIGVTVSTGLLINAGCGGGSSSPRSTPTPIPTGGTPTPTPTPVLNPVALKAAIIWGPRSRQIVENNAVGGPSSALSAILRLPNGNSAGGDLTQTLNRGVASGRQDYSSAPTLAKPGVYNLSVEFHANADGTGPVVGTAAASATVLADGTLSTTIATFGTIQGVTVVPNQVVKIGETKSILYSAKDKDGNVIAVTPGSAFINIVDATSSVSGQPSIQVQGEDITGVNPSKGIVTVTVDSATSPAAQVTVASSVALTVTPNPATVSILLAQQFNANITNDGPAGSNGVTWTLKEGTNAGTVTSTGLFTATRNEGNFTLIATSVYDPNISVQVPITVASQVAVTVTPNPAPAVSFKGGTQQFTASVSSVPDGQDTGVTWSVAEGSAGGNITSEGLYTAPATAGTYTIVATSKFDTRKSTSVKVTVASLATVTVTPANPGPISIHATQQFTGTVTGTAPGGDTGIDWSIAEGNVGGTIDANGLYTAGGTPGTYTIVATSRFDNQKVATVKIQVQSGTLPITVN